MSATHTMTIRLRRLTTVVTKGFFEVTHNSFALIGLAVLFATMALLARPELRELGEVKLFGWLQERQVIVTGLVSDPVASERATATDPADLPKQQAAVAFWLSKKYNVAPEPISALVSEAYEIGSQTRLEPTLILAVMAIESGFNPFAQSPVGAQGLMQVMTKVHDDKYEAFGGIRAAFDPVANLRVGVQVLKECIARAGGLDAGLRHYVGAGNTQDDGGYVAKVLSEQLHLQRVAEGRTVAVNAPNLAPQSVTPLLPAIQPLAPAASAAMPERVALLQR